MALGLWLYILRGIATIAVGIYAVGRPEFAEDLLILMIALNILSEGIGRAWNILRTPKNTVATPLWWVAIAQAAVNTVVGAILLMLLISGQIRLADLITIVAIWFILWSFGIPFLLAIIMRAPSAPPWFGLLFGILLMALSSALAGLILTLAPFVLILLSILIVLIGVATRSAVNAYRRATADADVGMT